MNMKKFKSQAINILKEEAIYNYMKNGDTSTYFLDIVNMINNLSPYLYNYRISINHTQIYIYLTTITCYMDKVAMCGYVLFLRCVFNDITQ